jgi:membrane-associated PAP2 superfamily phosphatase
MASTIKTMLIMSYRVGILLVLGRINPYSLDQVPSEPVYMHKKVNKWMKMAELLEDLLHLRMELFILDNGLTVSEMGMELRCGLMVQDMKENGQVIKQMALGNLSMPMVMSMKDNG